MGMEAYFFFFFPSIFLFLFLSFFPLFLPLVKRNGLAMNFKRALFTTGTTTSVIRTYADFFPSLQRPAICGVSFCRLSVGPYSSSNVAFPRKQECQKMWQINYRFNVILLNWLGPTTMSVFPFFLQRKVSCRQVAVDEGLIKMANFFATWIVKLDYTYRMIWTCEKNALHSFFV